MLSFTKFVFLIFISLFAVTFVNAQDISVGVSKDINMPGQDNVLFGHDVLIADSEPEGPISGVKATDGTVWVAINDTTISAGRGLVFYKSTNNGTNWTQHGTFIQPAFKADQVKMFKAGDSTYCFFRIGGTVYRFNVGNSSFGTFTPAANITQFDVVASSTNSLYIYYANATQVIRYGSIDGGFTWANNGNVTTNVRPVLGISATGDTLDVMYRGAGGETTAITRFRYRETAPGVLAVTGSSLAVLAAGPTRTQYYPFRYSGVEWIVYTEGTTPNIELKCIVSVNGGTTYGAPITIATGAGIDNFWFAGGMSVTGSFIGLDLFYYRDSVIAGPPTNASDKLKYAYASVTNSSAFGYLVPGVSENPPVSNSTADYKPCAIELGNADVGVIFVGETSGSRKVYFDRLSSITNITNNNTIADNYSLSQNYPNPFNPSTTIKFSIPKSEYVSLKIYDIMGKEIATLVNSQLNMGSYSVDFNAKNLSSGVYFYKLISGDFTEVKRMTLVK
jgi:hypothetical protein